MQLKFIYESGHLSTIMFFGCIRCNLL